MTAPTVQPPVAAPAPARETVAAKATRLTGKVIYMYAFDVAYELIRTPLRELLGQPVATFAVDTSKRAPRHLFFYRPQMIRLPPVEKIGPGGLVRIDRAVKLLPVGAISISVSVPFSVEKLEDLVAFHDPRFGEGRSLYVEVRSLAEQVRQELAPSLIRPHAALGDEEAYTAFCINGPLVGADARPLVAEDWMMANRRHIAAVLTEESDPNYLSDQEADESSARYFSYSTSDLVVIDWDAALVVDDPRHFDEVLYVMELANVQLAELEAYDRLLDDAVERSYRDMNLRGWRNWFRPIDQRELREIRMDLARLSDELQNISKFFGDWHLARVYQGIAARFHLADWHRSVDSKLKTLDDIYQILHNDRMTRWMVLLETMIVLLFLYEVIKPFVTGS
jgi:hypothetical protein